MHIILHQPEIPGNTGNIGRTCVATGTPLHLIEPLGFRLDEKSIRRAGMDYWRQLEVHRYVNFAEFREAHPEAVIWMATTKAKRTYTEVAFGPDDYIMFGKESAGIPEEILVEYEENCIRIPMLPSIRSLNLSNAVSIVLYEALRQNGFGRLQREGELHRLQWHSGGSGDSPLQSEKAVREGASLQSAEGITKGASLQSAEGITKGTFLQSAESNREGTSLPSAEAVSESLPPQPAGRYFTASGAVVLGDVRIGENASIWYHAVVRGDRAAVRIGRGSNIQDNCVVHVDAGFPVDIGENVTVGHGTILHGCAIGDNSLIGMGAVLMNGCRVGKNCIVGAGALITQGTVIPDNSLVLGSPGRVKRPVTEEEIENNLKNAEIYAREAAQVVASTVL